MKQLYSATHTHKFGSSFYLMRSDHLPSKEEVIKQFEIDFGPDRDETLDIFVEDEPIELPPQVEVVDHSKLDHE